MRAFHILMLALLFFATPAFANHLEARMQRLWAWLDNNTEFHTTDIPLPRIEWRSQKQLDAMYCGGNCSGSPDVLALYKEGTIFLRNAFDAGPDTDYILVHELVHHVQFELDIEYRCPALRERAAYEVQIQYVDATGTGKKPGELFYYMLTCQFGQ